MELFSIKIRCTFQLVSTVQGQGERILHHHQTFRLSRGRRAQEPAPGKLPRIYRHKKTPARFRSYQVPSLRLFHRGHRQGFCL